MTAYGATSVALAMKEFVRIVTRENKGIKMTDADIVKIAEQFGLCAIVRGDIYPNDALWFDGLWFDGNMIPFARAIIEAYEKEKRAGQ